MKHLPNINKPVPEMTDPANIKVVSDAIEAAADALGLPVTNLTTTAKSIVPAINELKGKVSTLEANSSLLAPLSVEYVIIPSETQRKFDIDLEQNKLVLLSENNDNNGYALLVTRFGSGGLVHTVIRDHNDFTMVTNAARSSFYITPKYATRGMVITMSQ